MTGRPTAHAPDRADRRGGRRRHHAARRRSIVAPHHRRRAVLRRVQRWSHLQRRSDWRRSASRRERHEARARRAPEHTLGVCEARDRVVIAAKPQGAIIVLSDQRRSHARVPAPIAMRRDLARAGRGSSPRPRAACSCGTSTRSSRARHPALAEQRAVRRPAITLIVDVRDAARRVDRSAHDTSARRSAMLGGDRRGRRPHRTVTLRSSIDLTRRAWLVAGLGQPQAARRRGERGGFIDDRRLVLAGAGGLRARRPAAAHEARAVRARRGRGDRGIAATAAGSSRAFEDGTLWRKHLADEQPRPSSSSPRSRRARRSRSPTTAPRSRASVASCARGARRQARRARDGTKPSPRSRSSVRRSRSRSTDDGRRAIVEPAAQPELGRAARCGTMAASTPRSPRQGSLVAARRVVGGVEVIDPLAGWQLAARDAAEGPVAVLGRRDRARRLAACCAMTADGCSSGRSSCPATAEATTAWLDKLTNATADTADRAHSAGSAVLKPPR